MLVVAHFLDRLCVYAARFAGLLLLVLTSVIIYDVVGRRFFNTGSVALQELEWHLHGAIAVLGFGYAYTRNAHVRIDALYQGFSNRLKIKLEILGIGFLLTPFLLGVMWFGYEFAERSFLRGEGSSGGLGLDHRWIIKSVVPVAAFLALCGAWSVVLRAVHVLQEREALSTPFNESALWKS